MAQAWIVRAGRNDEYEEMALAHGLVGVGWRRVGDLARRENRSEISRLVHRKYPEISPHTQDAYAVQLYAFRRVMQIGDIVVLLRSNAPDVAIGQIIGDYTFRSDLPGPHVRPVRWLNSEVRRSQIDAELLDPPALSVVYRIGPAGAAERLREATGERVDASASVASSRPAEPDVSTADIEDSVSRTSSYENLSRNLNYARNLTAAGSHLQKLQVALFEVTDVYRAAWVQAVAALDHWVHLEIYDRMTQLCGKPGISKPSGYRKFDLPLGVFEEVQAGKLTLQAALDTHIRAKLGFETYQNPDKIRDGLRYVADVTNLWGRVALVLCEQAGTNGAYTGQSVQDRLREIVHRRNKIAHEYDEDTANPVNKRSIDAASTMQTIEWIDQLAAAILVVIDQ